MKKDTVLSIINDLDRMHPQASCALDFGSVFHLLIAVVLSAQTTDVSVNKATPALFEKYPDAYALAEADQEDVMGYIKTIGMYRQKSRNIINLSRDIITRFDGEVPDNMEDLISLPGVGRKTANVVLSEGFGQQRIAVDTHVFRVSNRIGLADAKDVTETEEQLMQTIPGDLW
ncbi:MAG: endonuclease III, partial [Oscillospiraceae bacterium]|nr:endonuclease III [Oscillospiraceae bacterium]